MVIFFCRASNVSLIILLISLQIILLPDRTPDHTPYHTPLRGSVARSVTLIIYTAPICNRFCYPICYLSVQKDEEPHPGLLIVISTIQLPQLAGRDIFSSRELELIFIILFPFDAQRPVEPQGFADNRRKLIAKAIPPSGIQLQASRFGIPAVREYALFDRIICKDRRQVIRVRVAEVPAALLQPLQLGGQLVECLLGTSQFQFAVIIVCNLYFPP